MNILVTGGAGFIGSNLTESLVSDDHNVTVLDNLHTGNANNLKKIENKIRFIKDTSQNINKIAPKNLDAIFHFGIPSSTPMYRANPYLVGEAINAALDIYEYAKEIKPIRRNVEELIFPDGKKVYLLAKGRLANLVLSEGHPSEVMDMSFALQLLMSEYIVKNKDSLKPGVLEVPVDIDDKVGFLKLQSMGIEIDTLTEEQYNYIHGYEEGT